jgi:hypothetical protein
MSPADNDAVRLDLNNPEFQRAFFELEKDQITSVVGTLRKLNCMTWSQIYADRGLKWELVHSYTGPKGEKRYSLRIGKGFRAIAFREGVWLRVLGLYPDHDSAYGKR